MMDIPSALLYFKDQSFAERLEVLLDEVGVVSARAAAPDEAERLAGELKPDLLLLEMEGKERDTGRLIASIQSLISYLPVIWFAASSTPSTIERVRRAGAFGLLAKSSDPTQIIRAVKTVLRGDAFFPGVNTFPATPGAKGLAESERLLKVLSKASG